MIVTELSDYHLDTLGSLCPEMEGLMLLITRGQGCCSTQESGVVSLEPQGFTGTSLGASIPSESRK